jgi:hypothetical protein
MRRSETLLGQNLPPRLQNAPSGSNAPERSSESADRQPIALSFEMLAPNAGVLAAGNLSRTERNVMQDLLESNIFLEIHVALLHDP